MARILSAVSGGVDSAVATALLVQQGHEVVGAYMKNWINEEGIPGECPWEQDIEDARAICRVLGIELRVVDLIEQYRARIVNYLLEGYRAGTTPNPDVLCNREIKFGVLLDYALEQGFEGVATGHYAKREDAPGGEHYILRGDDPNKDQSYFLALMSAEQVAHAIFPIGGIAKPRVRELARKFNLPVAFKKDSQGICFIGQVKMSDFLRHFIPDNPGAIVDTSGRVLGHHLGLHLFTIGQRKGHHIASPREGVAYVVVGKDIARNRLILDYESQDAPGLYASGASVSHITNGCHPLPERVLAQPRYRSPAEPASLRYIGDDCVQLTFDRPVRALSPGQICAFYDPAAPARLLAGGFFSHITSSRPLG